MASRVSWLKKGRAPFKVDVILRALCRPHGSASALEPLLRHHLALGYSVPESPRPVGKSSEDGRWTTRGRGRENNLRHFSLAVLPTPLCRKARECFLEARKGRRYSHLKQDLSRENVGVEFRDLSFGSSSVTLGRPSLLWACFPFEGHSGPNLALL